MEIIVPGQYSESDVRRAHLQNLEFRRNPYTSGSANLDNMVALNKAVLLCDTHVRKFNAKASKYVRHPAKNLRRVHGKCEVCNEYSLTHLFICERDALQEKAKLDKWRRGSEYSRFVSS